MRFENTIDIAVALPVRISHRIPHGTTPATAQSAACLRGDRTPWLADQSGGRAQRYPRRRQPPGQGAGGIAESQAVRAGRTAPEADSAWGGAAPCRLQRVRGNCCRDPTHVSPNDLGTAVD